MSVCFGYRITSFHQLVFYCDIVDTQNPKRGCFVFNRVPIVSILQQQLEHQTRTIQSKPISLYVFKTSDTPTSIK